MHGECGVVYLKKACVDLLRRHHSCITKKYRSVLNNKPTSTACIRILELGSGTGLVGIIVSKLGNSKVVLTDGDEEAMGLLDQNLADPYNEIDASRVKATFLRWNEQLDEFDCWCRGNVFDDDESSVDFDILLAGDVMYKNELPALFFKTADRYLSRKGILWLCHVPRSTVTHQVVKDAAVAAGFRIETVDTTNVVVKDCPKIDLDRAVVYKITR
jgi:predicted nicotinamide N-methyase